MTNLDLTQGQTGRSTRGRTPIYQLEVDGEELDATVLSAQLSFGVGQHDMVGMTLSSQSITTVEDLAGKPVTFLYGQSPRTDRFYGYIISAPQKGTSGDALEFALVILGSTHVLQGGQVRVWEGRTIPGVCGDIAASSGLGFDSPLDDYPWGLLIQTDQSDWEKLVELADRLGWWVTSRYGVVQLIDPQVQLTKNGPYATLESANPDDEPKPDTRQLLGFDAEEESDDSPWLIGKRYGYFDGTTAQSVTQEGEFQRLRFMTDIVIGNSAEANRRRQAWDLRDSFDKQTATARLLGYGDLHVGMPLDVVTSDYRIYRGKYDGRWLVKEVIHKMDRATFQTQVSLCRYPDALGVDTPYRSFWEGRGRPQMYLVPDTSEWFSTWANVTAKVLAS